MAGLKPMFAMDAIQDYLDSAVNQADQKFLETLQYAGEEFVNNARINGNYTDDTGNLRSSIGYVILKDGKTIDSNFVGNKAEGQKIARRFAKELAQELSQEESKGYVLIGVAGMSYAAAVESRGYDVISGSAPVYQDLQSLFNAIRI